MLQQIFIAVAKWFNDNQGVTSVLIFGATLLVAWVTGIFSALRRRPKFKINTIDGPTFCCTFTTGKQHNGYDVHRTGIALYLSVSNVGSAPSSIEDVCIGYHWHLNRVSLLWLRYKIGWYWLQRQAISLTDFQVQIGDQVKVFPFLIQRSSIMPIPEDTFLEIGKSAKGVVYFEQEDSWGGCFPSPAVGSVRIKVKITDVFGGHHTAKFRIPFVDFAYGLKYNPSFGQTYAKLRGESLPENPALPRSEEATRQSSAQVE